MPATIKIDIDQIKGLISQVSLKEKQELAKYLDSMTLRSRFKKVLAAKKHVSLSFEDITAEVEKVRTKRYQCG